MHDTDRLFALLDRATVAGEGAKVASARNALPPTVLPPKQAVIFKGKQRRQEMRRVKAEKHLAEILPAHFADDCTYHILSHGDIDALSYLRHAIAGYGYFDLVVVSTWCIAMPDLLELRRWLDAGVIDTLELYGGEIFPSQYPDEYALATRMAADYAMRLTVARNHAKIILAQNEALDAHLVMEGSANVNTNPRIEQTCITNSQPLLNFQRDFFRGLKTIDRQPRAHPS